MRTILRAYKSLNLSFTKFKTFKRKFLLFVSISIVKLNFFRLLIKKKLSFLVENGKNEENSYTNTS